MIVYQATKAQFLKHAFEDDVHEVVGAAYKERTGRRVGPSEFAAWKESLVSMAKVLIYLIRLSQVLGLDLIAASKSKLRENARKYPVAKSRGSAKKYTELK